MTVDPAWALQKAIHGALAGDGDLTTLLGGPDIFDDVPAGRAFPYVTFGQTIARDWGTASGEGREHLVTLNVWSRQGGRRDAGEIIAAIEAALGGAALTLDDHTLVNLRLEFTETRRAGDGETFHGLMRYRAVTEPAD